MTCIILYVSSIKGIVSCKYQNSSSFKRLSTSGETKTGLGLRFILLLPQTAVLPGSDAGSNGVEPAWGFVIQNCQISCSTWFLMYRMGSAIKTWSVVCSGAPHLQFGEGTRPDLCMERWDLPSTQVL